jgi:prophage regulatory protein
MTRILRRREVEERTGLRRSSLYLKVRAGQFPSPVPLGPRAVGWIEAEIEEWIAARVAARPSARANEEAVR